MALTNFSELKNHLETEIAAKNTDIDHFVHGDVDTLQDFYNNNDGTVLFLERPSMKPRDRDGSVDLRYSFGCAILEKVDQRDQPAINTSIENGMETAVEILRRLRKDQNTHQYNFTINQIRTIDPVKLYNIDNCCGARIEFQDAMGYHTDLALNPDKWTDVS